MFTKQNLLHQDVSESFDMSGPSSGFSSDASGVALQYQILILNYIYCNTTSFLIRIDTDSCFSLLLLGRFGIKTVLDTVELQRGLWPNQLLPPVTAQRGCAGFPISDQWVQRVGLLVDHNEPELLSNLHTVYIGSAIDITFILTNSLQGRLTPSYRRSSRLVSILHLNIQDVPCNRERRLVWNPSGGLPIHLHQT